MRLFEIKNNEATDPEKLRRAFDSKSLKGSSSSDLESLAKESVKLIQKDCKSFLQEINKGQTLYRGMKYLDSAENPLTYENTNVSALFFSKKVRKDRRIRDLPKTITETLNNIFETLQSPVRRENSLFVYGRKPEFFYGTPYVIFPIGDIEYVWSSVIEDPFYLKDDEDIFDKDEEKIAEYKRELEEEETEIVRLDIEEKIKGEVALEWFNHFYQKAQEYYNNLPDTDPDRYSRENMFELANKWVEHHDEERKKKVKELVELELHSEESQHRIQNAVAQNMSFIKTTSDFPSNRFYKFNAEKMFDKYANTYNTNNLKSAIADPGRGHEIMIYCEKYYALDEDFYELFVKDKLWH